MMIMIRTTFIHSLVRMYVAIDPKTQNIWIFIILKRRAKYYGTATICNHAICQI